LPDAGIEHLDAETVKSKGANFLFEEIKSRVAQGPVGFQILVQMANPGDIPDDATVLWPEDRQLLNFGKLSLTNLVPDDAHRQKNIIFDPIPRVDGIEPSGDPLLELRAAVYLLSGRRRRKAPE
jgi:catalase